MINGFFKEYRWLSNFHETPIVYEGIPYPTVEHAYQAAKTDNVGDKIAISKLKKPGKARRLGQTVTCRSEWNDVKLSTMYELTKIKYKDPILREKLLGTIGHELVESNTWGDSYWGFSNGFGANNLGKILMLVRSEIARDEMVE